MASEAEKVFLAAVRLSGKEREAFLTAVCHGNPGLRERVEALLRAHDEAGSFMEIPAVAGAASTLRSHGETANDGNSAAFLAEEQPPPSWLPVDLSFLEPTDDPEYLGALGHHHVRRLVGHGGMGMVLEAHDTRLHRTVALKVMFPQLATSESARIRFLREARAAAAIDHPHVVNIHAVEDHPLPYLVMPYVDGRALSKLLASEGALGEVEVARIAMQVAAGLGQAHACGLIHRDIKPANILIETTTRAVKLTDFGLARSAEDFEITSLGALAGTPLYMSPEQADGEPLDARSDLFSLGSVLYTMCSGEPAFRADSTLAVLRRVREAAPVPVRERNPAISPPMAAMIEKLMARQPADRYQTADEVCEAMRDHLVWLDSVPSAAAESGIDIEKAFRPHRPHRPTRPRRWLAVAALLLIVIAISAAAAPNAEGITRWLTTVLRIEMPHGVLVITTDGSEFEVLVDGEKITLDRPGVARLEMDVGEHLVEARREGETFYREVVKLQRDGRQVARVEIRGKPARSKPARVAADAPWIEVNDPAPVPPGSESWHYVLSSQWQWALKILPHPPLSDTSHNNGGPDVSADELTIYFHSDRQPGAGRRDLWTSTRPTKHHPWTTPENLGSTVNSPFDEAHPCVARDGTLLVFESDRGDSRDLWFCTRPDTSSPWSSPTALPRNVNSPWSESSPSLSPDGNVLYFASDRPTGLGGDDVWMARRDEANDRWSEPVNVQVVNSTAKDAYPSVAADGLSLLLTSDRGDGPPNLDVWICTRASVTENWTPPFSMGEIINSHFPESGAFLTADGRTVWLESSGLTFPYGNFQFPSWSIVEWQIRPADRTVVAPEGKTVVAHEDAPFPWTAELRWTKQVHGGRICDVDFANDGTRLASGAADGQIVISQVPSGELITSFRAHEGVVEAVDFRHDGERLLSAGNDGRVREWEPVETQRIREWKYHREYRDAAYSPRGKYLAAGADDGRFQIWEAASGDEFLSVREPTADFGTAISAIRFDPAEQRLAVAFGNRVQVWDVESKTIARTIIAHGGGISRVVFVPPDAKTIITGSADATARLWEVSTGRLLQTFAGHTSPIHELEVAPDGRVLVTCGSDGTTRVWDVASGSCLATCFHSSTAAGFDPDGRYFATGDQSGTLRLWEVTRADGTR